MNNPAVELDETADMLAAAATRFDRLVRATRQST